MGVAIIVDKDIASVSGKASIGKTLLVVFLLLATLPLVAALLGWVNHSQMRIPLQRAASMNLAFGSNNQQLASAILEIEQFTYATRGIELGPDSQDVLSRVEARLDQVRNNLRVLRELNPGDKAIIGISSDYDELHSTISAILNTELMQSQERKSLIKRIELLQENVAKLERHLADLVAGKSLQGAQKNHITELRFTNRSLGLLLENLLNTDDVREVSLLAEKFKDELHRSVLQLSLIKDEELSQQLALKLNAFFLSGSGDSSVFSERSAVVQQARLQAQRRATVGELGRSILAKSLALQEANDRDLRESLKSVSKYQQRSVVSLLFLALAATTLAAWVYVRYVRRTLVRRLNRLRAVTKQITSGNFDVKINTAGSDEIAELACALVSFRQSMLDLRESDLALKARAAELEISNRELDKFAYVASHDLRSPLRGIDSLASFLQEDLAGVLPDSSVRHLRLMRSRIGRLEALLESLLAYYRVGKQDQNPTRIDIKQFLQQFADLFDDGRFHVRHDINVTAVRTYRTPLELILRNLVDNAIKHHDKNEGEILISATLEDSNLVIAVSDDGPGIAPEFHERVFGVFQTLNARDKIEGSGMGLAIIAKMVDAYGGTIRVHSTPRLSRGSRFELRWPVFELERPHASDTGALHEQLLISAVTNVPARASMK